VDKISVSGKLTFRENEIWYGIAGESAGLPPVLVVHGGPGLPHDALESLSFLTDFGHQVIFYDQLGCGHSSRPVDAKHFTQQYFIDELAHLRSSLQLDQVHIYAHSYGGPIALNYLLTRPEGVKSVILADTFPSTSALVQGWYSLVRNMPSEVQDLILEFQETGHTSDEKAYNEAFNRYFVAQHACRVPIPSEVQRAFAKTGNEVYQRMHGPRWFTVTGQYKDWDVTARLNEIDVPALILCGEFDQCVPDLSRTLHENLPQAELTIISDCSHLPFIEKPEIHRSLVTQFLKKTS
jgi:proline-specific peptidase